MQESLSFDDVLLTPQYSKIISRKNIGIGGQLDSNIELTLPIISSPMDTVTEHRMASVIAGYGGVGIVHRYNSIAEQVDHVRKAKKEAKYVGAAIGVTGDYERRACALQDAGADIICLDVAHGHHTLVRNALETLRDVFGDKVHLMAGNVATLEAFNDLADWGADSIRVGIGGGSICSTRIQTGHGMPTFQSILDCARSDRNAKLIADGGIKNGGDIVKALAAGADFVMLGSMLAGTDETPGEIFMSKNKRYKVYRGMASHAAQVDWKGSTNSLEGISTTIPYKGTVNDVFTELAQGIRSGLSYSGVNNLLELQAKARFIKQTSAGQFESSTHILRR